ncbi:MAG: TPM domain-containing protein [Hyphomicrobiales bacterium]
MTTPEKPGKARLLAAFAALAGAVTATALLFLPTDPVRVDDRADILDPLREQAIADYHAAVLADRDIDLRVVTIAGLDDIDRAANELYREMRVGSASRDGLGALLLVDPQNATVRLEIGRGLEPVFTDAFVIGVETRQMVPFFEDDRIADGILATTELLVARAECPTCEGAVARAPEDAGDSAGGGARTTFDLGLRRSFAVVEVEAVDTRPPASPSSGPAAAPSLAPEAVVDAYIAAMAAGNTSPDLDIYSRASRAMLANWTVTPAQMDNVVSAHAACPLDRVLAEGDRAVLRYAASARTCSPYFLVREDGAWRLDFTVMQGTIRFNHRNEWHFTGAGHGYGFAFRDWRFDRNGFPAAS